MSAALDLLLSVYRRIAGGTDEPAPARKVLRLRGEVTRTDDADSDETTITLDGIPLPETAEVGQILGFDGADWVAVSPFDPSDIASMTLWLPDDAAQITHTNGDGGEITQWTDVSGGTGSNYIQNLLGLYPIYRATGGPAGGPCVEFDGTDDVLFGANLSTVFAAGAKTMLIVCRADSAPAGGGSYFDDAQITGDSDAYWGVAYSTVSGTAKITAWNWDGAEQFCQFNAPISTWHAFVVRHGSGTLKLKPLGGSETSVASGDTQALNHVHNVGRGGSLLNGKIATVIAWNVHVTDQERDDLLDWAQEHFGL